MFFKRGKEKAGDAPEGGPAPVAALVVPAAGASGPSPLVPAELRRLVDPKSLGFKTTADLKPGAGPVGQTRALEAIDFGLAIKGAGYNVFVVGEPGTGRRAAVRTAVARHAAKAAAPPDWVYVTDFDDPTRPRALTLPRGRAARLAEAMTGAITELRATLPAAFSSEDYEARRRAIDEEFRASRDDGIDALSRKAAQQNIAIMRTPLGFGLAPMHDGKVVKPEVFGQLPTSMRREVEGRIGILQKELEARLAESPKADRLRRARLLELSEEAARSAVEIALAPVKAAFADLPAVTAYLAAAERDLVDNAGLFLSETGDEQAVLRQPARAMGEARYRRYLVNAFVTERSGAATATGAPVIEEQNPTLANLVGRIEHTGSNGALVTDALLVKPGALHRANGGYLLLDAATVLAAPAAWDALKRALGTGEIRADPPAPATDAIAAETLVPESIPLDLKVILFADRALFDRLSRDDPEAASLFKVQAEFDSTMAATKENIAAFAGLIAAVLAAHKLKPLDAAAAARVIEDALRRASDREQLSLDTGALADLLRQADHWAEGANRKVTGLEDVTRAIDERRRRASRPRDTLLERLERADLLLDTEGLKVGQINTLSAPGGGEAARPHRVTARVHVGRDGGGTTPVLWGYLAGQFAESTPLMLAASVVSEDAGGTDSDTTAAGLYALLSALAEAPIRQDLAVAGSLSQSGEVLAVSGVNESIESFFDVCRARGLSGTQGVIVPRAGLRRLMLREDVVDAVKDGRFAVYAVARIDEGIEILTGLKAGERRGDGLYPAGTINRLVEDKLKAFAERARRFARGDDAAPGKPSS